MKRGIDRGEQKDTEGQKKETDGVKQETDKHGQARNNNTDSHRD